MLRFMLLLFMLLRFMLLFVHIAGPNGQTCFVLEIIYL